MHGNPPRTAASRARIATLAVVALLAASAGLVTSLGPTRAGEPPPLAATVPARAEDSLYGTVLGLDGAPIGDGMVTIVDAISRQQARTDANGAFVLPRQPIGPARVEVTAPGFAALILPSMRVTNPLVLAPARAFFVDGLVVDESTGAPVPAELFLPNTSCPPADPWGSNDELTLAETASELLATADDGTFRVQLDERSATTFVFAATHEAAMHAWTRDGLQRIPMKRSRSRRLHVVDETGTAVVGAQLRRAAGYARPGETVLALDGGEATVPEVLLRGAFVSAAGHVPVHLGHGDAKGVGPDDTPWRVTMVRSRTVRGRLQTPDDTELGVAWLMPCYRLPGHRHSYVLPWQRPEADGTFVLEVPPAAEDLTIRVLHPEWEAEPSRVLDQTPIDIVLQPASRSPLHPAALPLPTGTGPLVLRLRSSVFGSRFAVVDPANPSSTADVRLPNEDGWSVDGWARHFEAVVLERPGSRRQVPRLLTGRVLDRSGRGIAGAVVTAFEAGAVQNDRPIAFSDREGRFHVPACFDLCKLVASHPHHGSGGVMTDATNSYRIVLQPR